MSGDNFWCHSPKPRVKPAEYFVSAIFKSRQDRSLRPNWSGTIYPFLSDFLRKYTPVAGVSAKAVELPPRLVCVRESCCGFDDPPQKSVPREIGSFRFHGQVCARLADTIAVNVTQVTVSSCRSRGCPSMTCLNALDRHWLTPHFGTPTLAR